jgi:hypothetical protein
MSCEIVAATGALFVLWGKPTRADIDRVEAEINDCVAKFGGPITYITRVPTAAPAPDAEARKHLNALMPRIVHACSTYHAVLEGDGFLAAMKRGIVTSLFQLGFHKGSFFVHSSVGEVALKVDKAVRVHVDDVLELAKRQGLLDRKTLSIPPLGRSYRSP